MFYDNKRKRIEDWTPNKITTDLMSKKLESLTISNVKSLSNNTCKNPFVQNQQSNNTMALVVRKPQILDEIEIEDCYIPNEKIITPSIITTGSPSAIKLYRSPTMRNDMQVVLYVPPVDLIQQAKKQEEDKEDRMDVE